MKLFITIWRYILLHAFLEKTHSKFSDDFRRTVTLSDYGSATTLTAKTNHSYNRGWTASVTPTAANRPVMQIETKLFDNIGSIQTKIH